MLLNRIMLSNVVYLESTVALCCAMLHYVIIYILCAYAGCVHMQVHGPVYCLVVVIRACKSYRCQDASCTEFAKHP